MKSSKIKKTENEINLVKERLNTKLPGLGTRNVRSLYGNINRGTTNSLVEMDRFGGSRTYGDSLPYATHHYTGHSRMETSSMKYGAHYFPGGASAKDY